MVFWIVSFNNLFSDLARHPRCPWLQISRTIENLWQFSSAEPLDGIYPLIMDTSYVKYVFITFPEDLKFTMSDLTKVLQ
jgi:hypothetical protein